MWLKSSISHRIFFKTETLYSIDFETLINWWSYQISLEKIHKNNLERNSREKQRWLPLWKNHIVNSSLSSLHIALWNWWPSFFFRRSEKNVDRSKWQNVISISQNILFSISNRVRKKSDLSLRFSKHKHVLFSKITSPFNTSSIGIMAIRWVKNGIPITCHE